LFGWKLCRKEIKGKSLMNNEINGGTRMDRDPTLRRRTALSYKTEEKTVMRGYSLSELAEEGYSFYDAMFVLFQSRIPTDKEEKMLKYEMCIS
jgi:citrate synthase